jgi:TRAP-type mannitol/chloroaromatic compound transport system permease small subunit
MLALLVGFLINNILIVVYDFPQIGALLDGNALSWVTLGVYLAGLGAAWWYVSGTPDRALRYDARKISAFNAYLIRGCFFSVLLVGIADAAIAFMRVEGLLTYIFSEDVAKEFLRARFVGPWIHYPLVALSFVIAYFSRSLGFIWLALMIVASELLIVISRFVFSYEQALMGDLVRYWYAALFLFSSAYTLQEEGHVRVDVLYAGFQQRTKGKINAIGSIMLGMVTTWTIIIIGLGGKQSIVNSPMLNFEISQTGSAGLFIKYQMAAFLAIFAITMLIQFVSYLFEAVADKRDEPGRRVVAEISH